MTEEDQVPLLQSSALQSATLNSKSKSVMVLQVLVYITPNIKCILSNQNEESVLKYDKQCRNVILACHKLIYEVNLLKITMFLFREKQILKLGIGHLLSLFLFLRHSRGL